MSDLVLLGFDEKKKGKQQQQKTASVHKTKAFQYGHNKFTGTGASQEIATGERLSRTNPLKAQCRC